MAFDKWYEEETYTSVCAELMHRAVSSVYGPETWPANYGGPKDVLKLAYEAGYKECLLDAEIKRSLGKYSK